jgi:hypothetical protein
MSAIWLGRGSACFTIEADEDIEVAEDEDNPLELNIEMNPQ